MAIAETVSLATRRPLFAPLEPGSRPADAPAPASWGILQFTDSLDPSGVGQHILILAAELAARGHRQAVVCPGVPSARSFIARCQRAGLPVYPLRVRAAEDGADFRRLVRLLRGGAFDLVHNHCGITWEGCWGTFAAAAAGVPVVCTEHLPYMMPDPTGRDLKLRAYRHVTASIAVSHGIARSFLAAEIVPPERLHVVWNGVETALFGPSRGPSRETLLGLSAERPLVVCVGRLTEQKRHDLLLDAVALARAAVPDLALAVAGDGPLRGRLERRAARLGLLAAGPRRTEGRGGGEAGGRAGWPDRGRAWGPATVRFLGSYPRVPDLLRCADVLAQPSAFEGHPLSVLEGMAAGLPALVTDTVGTNETVVHERSGLVVPPDDPPALAAALVRLLRDKPHAARLGAAARRRAARHFSALAMARRTLAVYAGVLAAVPGAAARAGGASGAPA
jgi:glycosyltransferase involved in cell wall biosynthesis